MAAMNEAVLIYAVEKHPGFNNLSYKDTYRKKDYFEEVFWCVRVFTDNRKAFLPKGSLNTVKLI